jgi:hypothetical protein
VGPLVGWREIFSDLTSDGDDLILEAAVGTDGVVIVGLVDIERAVSLRISGLGNLFVNDCEGGFEIRSGGKMKKQKIICNRRLLRLDSGLFEPLEAWLVIL